MYCSSDSESKSSSDVLDDDVSQLSSSINHSINHSIPTTYDSFNLPPRIKSPDPPYTKDLLELAELAGIPIPERLGSIMIQMLNEGASPVGIVSVLSTILSNKTVKRVPNDLNHIVEPRSSDPRLTPTRTCSRGSNCHSTLTSCTSGVDFSVATEYLDRCNLMSQASPTRTNDSASSKQSFTSDRNNEELVSLVDMLEQWKLAEN